MDASRQRAIVRKAIVARKQQGQASGSTPKGAPKATLKRKNDGNDGKDNRPPKKGIGSSFGDHHRRSPSPPPPLPVIKLGKA